MSGGLLQRAANGPQSPPQCLRQAVQRGADPAALLGPAAAQPGRQIACGHPLEHALHFQQAVRIPLSQSLHAGQQQLRFPGGAGDGGQRLGQIAPGGQGDRLRCPGEGAEILPVHKAQQQRPRPNGGQQGQQRPRRQQSGSARLPRGGIGGGKAQKGQKSEENRHSDGHRPQNAAGQGRSARLPLRFFHCLRLPSALGLRFRNIWHCTISDGEKQGSQPISGRRRPCSGLCPRFYDQQAANALTSRGKKPSNGLKNVDGVCIIKLASPKNDCVKKG